MSEEILRQLNQLADELGLDHDRRQVLDRLVHECTTSAHSLRSQRISLLNTYRSIHWDLEAKRTILQLCDEVQSMPKQINIYLDTNVLIPIIIPEDPFRYTLDVVELARDLGCNLIVVDRTLQELRHLVRVQFPFELRVLGPRIKKYGVRAGFSSLFVHYYLQSERRTIFQDVMLRALDRALDTFHIQKTPSKQVDQRTMEEERHLFAAHGRYEARAVEHDIILSETVKQAADQGKGLNLIVTNDMVLSRIKGHLGCGPMALTYIVLDPLYRVKTAGKTLIRRIESQALDGMERALTIRQYIYTTLAVSILRNAIPPGDDSCNKPKCTACRNGFVRGENFPSCIGEGAPDLPRT